MKLGPLLRGRKSRRTQKVPRNIFRGSGFGVQHLCRAVRPVGGLKSGGMGRTGLTAAGRDETGTTSPWQKIEEHSKSASEYF